MTSAAGVRMPRLLYGTAWKKGETERLVALALREGFRGIDTACQPRHYHEPGVGAGIAAALTGDLARADLYIQTKFTPVSGQDPTRVPYDPSAPLAEQVAQSCAVSLRNLQTDYLDSLVLHSPLATIRETLEAWRAMESLVDGGGVRQLGISNCDRLDRLEALQGAARIRPAVLQNRFYADTGYDRELRAFCARERIIYQSFWTLTANPQILAHPVSTSIARSRGRTPAQILFRYLIECGVVPLTGTRSPAHMREDLAIFEFELDGDDRRALGRVLGAAE
ncbi:MAG TPA: aldo/keto reductase [Steroidobacteraceae bacterium]|nr:aldo/keto reductase [Steroidobacteraceae bacterium]